MLPQVVVQFNKFALLLCRMNWRMPGQIDKFGLLVKGNRSIQNTYVIGS